MSTRRASLAAFLTVTLTAVVVIVLGSPSQAEPRKLLISNSISGPFQGNLATPLFKGAGPFVPLDEASNTVYVKNNSDQTARTTVRVVNRGRTPAFEDSLAFDIDINGISTGGTAPLPGTPGCSMVVTGPSIAPGAVQAVDIDLAVGELPARVGMNQAASLDFVVTLSQTGSNGWVEVCGEQATAQPEVKGEPGGGSTNGDGSDPDCTREVVVTAVGTPTCVPTAVDAGATYGGGAPRGPREIALLVGLLVTTGASMVVWASRRRTR